MIQADGSFDFIQEIADLVDAFLAQYEETEGAFHSPIERAMVISYALGAIRDDAEDIWKRVDNTLELKGLSPRQIYEQGQYAEREAPGHLLAIDEAIRMRGWVSRNGRKA